MFETHTGCPHSPLGVNMVCPQTPRPDAPSCGEHTLSRGYHHTLRSCGERRHAFATMGDGPPTRPPRVPARRNPVPRFAIIVIAVLALTLGSPLAAFAQDASPMASPAAGPC